MGNKGKFFEKMLTRKLREAVDSGGHVFLHPTGSMATSPTCVMCGIFNIIVQEPKCANVLARRIVVFKDCVEWE